jgi:hypothetical protein
MVWGEASPNCLHDDPDPSKIPEKCDLSINWAPSADGQAAAIVNLSWWWSSVTEPKQQWQLGGRTPPTSNPRGSRKESQAQEVAMQRQSPRQQGGGHAFTWKPSPQSLECFFMHAGETPRSVSMLSFGTEKPHPLVKLLCSLGFSSRVNSCFPLPWSVLFGMVRQAEAFWSEFHKPYFCLCRSMC